MKISDFELLGTIGEGLEKVYFAEVTVTLTRFLWFTSARRQIFREIGSPWFFADTGTLCPGYQCQQLERAWNAKKLLEEFQRLKEDDASV